MKCSTMRCSAGTTRKLLSAVFALALAGSLVPAGRAAADATSETPDVLDTQSTALVNGESVEISRDGTTSWTAAGAGTLNVITLDDTGLYRLSVVGAGGGGTSYGSIGGAGGTTTAVTPLDGQTIYAVPGGRGVDGRAGAGQNGRTAGGANGGGSGGEGNHSNVTGELTSGGSGGGASHFALASGSLAEVLAGGDDANLIIAAGGGGGGGRNARGGTGGGTAGENGRGDGSPYAGEIPTSGGQAGGFQMGQGEDGGNGLYNVDFGCEGRGGGGGGYWGGHASSETAAHTDASGAGGSGFLSGTNIVGTKAEGGGVVTKDGATVATTARGTNTGAGSVSIEYLASIVDLDAGDGVATTGTTTLFSAPDADDYYGAYSIDGLEGNLTSIVVPTRTEGIRYFAGYFTEPGHGGERYVTPEGAIEEGLFEEGSTTLYAGWGVLVSFDANGVEAAMPETQNIDRGERATRPADPAAPAGMRFVGWSSEADSYVPVDFESATFDADATVYAHWSPKVTFDTDGLGDPIAPQFVAPGGTVVRPEDPTSPNQVFVGWYRDDAHTQPWDFDTDVVGEEDLTLHALWTAREYRVMYYDGDAYKDFSTHTYGEPSALATASSLGLSRDYWTFDGWRATSTLAVDYDDGEVVDGIVSQGGLVELHAVWRRNITFTSGYNTNLTPGHSTEVVRMQLSDRGQNGAVTAPDLEGLEGWRGLGWLGSSLPASAPDVDAGVAFVPQDVTEFYGLYSRDVTVTFDGGEDATGTVAPIGDVQRLNSNRAISSVTLTLPPSAFTRPGWRFAGWDLGAAGEPIALSPEVDESSAYVAHALWDGPFEYTIDFDANGGAGEMDPMTVPEHAEVALDACTLSFEGKAFAGWNTAADGSGTSYADGASVKDLATAGESVTLYAQWVDEGEPEPDPDPEPEGETPDDASEDGTHDDARDATREGAREERASKATPKTADDLAPWAPVALAGITLVAVAARGRRGRRVKR